MQYVLTIAYTAEKYIFNKWREEALALLGMGKGVMEGVYLRYIDISLVEMRDGYRGVMPCRSIWDISGSRLSAVLLLD